MVATIALQELGGVCCAKVVRERAGMHSHVSVCSPLDWSVGRLA